MAYAQKFGNYVKFLRGTPAAWELIDSKDADTLYFIAEEGSDVGKLYLGAKLIADGETAQVNTLKELTDVLLSEGIPENSILAYDYITDKWVNRTFEELISIYIKPMVGASSEKNGQSGLVPQPKVGDQDLYLRGDGKWADPTAALSAVVTTLQETVEENKREHEADILTLLGGESKGTTIQQIVKAKIAEVVGDAPETFDTLEELAAWIAEHDSVMNVAEIIAEIQKINTTLYPVDTGLVSRVEKAEKDLYGDGTTAGLVATTSTLVLNVSQLQGQMSTANKNIADIQGDISEILDMLKWIDFYDDEA